MNDGDRRGVSFSTCPMQLKVFALLPVVVSMQRNGIGLNLDKRMIYTSSATAEDSSFDPSSLYGLGNGNLFFIYSETFGWKALRLCLSLLFPGSNE